MIRTFLAINPSEEVLENLKGLQNELRQTGADVRWIAAAAMHLTIQFLGEVREAEIAGIERALVESFRTQRPFDMESRGLGVFPNQRKPRVLWAGLHGAGLREIAERAETALSPLGFPPEERESDPHITLGRIRSMRGWEHVAAAIRDGGERSFGASRVDRATLYRSDLRPDRAVYSPIVVVPFGGA